MNKSDSIELLSKALVKAQAEMPAVTMDATNPFFKSRYATLGAIIEATRPVLAKYGLAVSQLPYTDTAEAGVIIVGVTTMLIHESGQFISQGLCVPVVDKNPSQAAGSAITYLRRYSLAAVLGIYSDEDDDGNTAHKKPAPVDEVVETMNIQDAVTVRSTDGKMYAEMDLAQLTAIYNAHGKKLKLADLPADERARIERDNAAIKSLIDSKRSK